MRGLFDTPELGPDTIEPFPHQEAAIAAARDALRVHPSALIVHATGTGKGTVIAKAARMAVDRGNRVLVLTHTDELVKDLAGRMDLAGIEPAIEQADQFARQMFEPQVVVASVATLQKTNRLLAFPDEYFQLILVDECHRAASMSYKKIVARFPKAKLLGFTATPKRSDDLSIGGMFRVVAHTFSILDAWDEERRTGVQYLCDLVPVKLGIGIDLRKLKASKGDFTDEDLDARITPMIEVICNRTADAIGDRPTIAFFPSIRAAQAYAKGMRDLGMAFEAVWGADPDRASKIEAYQKRELQGLANMDLLGTGFDAPHTSAVVLCRPTKSWTLFLQQIGRGTRRGKADCRIIDPGFLTDDFGLVQPTDLIDVPGFDREIAAIAAELVRETPGMSLRTAVEEARTEHERRERRKQYAVHMAIAERKIDCYEESFSMKAAHHEGETFTGKVTAPDAKFRKPSPAQIALLERHGFSDAATWSRGRAGDMIGRLKRQMDAGKSKLWQRGKLIRAGVDAADAREMSRDQADEAIGRLSGN